MKAAIVRGPGETPVYGDFEAPEAAPDALRVSVSASALSHLVRMRASGQHYSSGGQFPFVAGVDGVGRLGDGQRVYFLLPRAPFGSMAELAVVPRERCVPLPDGLDDVTAAALANPGMSSWAAFTERARLKPGETVLINGATGASGRLAVQIARHLGAGKVIATGRNPAALEEVASLGADETIALVDDEAALETRFKAVFAQGVDVVLDYLWGMSARTMLVAAARTAGDGVPMRFVQIGSISGAEISLPSAVLRASAIELMGSGIGSVTLEGLVRAIGGVMQAAIPAGLRIATHAVPLSDVTQAWAAEDGSARTVFTIGGQAPQPTSISASSAIQPCPSG